MNLYRLDTDHGPILDSIGQVVLCQRFTEALRIARMAAVDEGDPVHITRISGGGQMKVSRTVYPSQG